MVGGCTGGIVSPGTTTPTPLVTTTSSPTTGSISGIVTEKGTGTPLSGVTITVDGTTTVTTASDGSYSISGLAPGFHTLKFERVGYKTETANVNVLAGADTPKAIELENTTGFSNIPIFKDTYIGSESSTVYGTNSHLILGAATATMEARILFQFDPSFYLPSGAEVISAKLKFYKDSATGGASLSFDVYPLTEEWDENFATWFLRTGLPWFTPGGSYDDTQIINSSSISTSGILAWEEIDISDAFTYWKSHDNYGLIIVPTVGTLTMISFYSSDASSENPYVEVEYYLP